jgi:hypothetical protein
VAPPRLSLAGEIPTAGFSGRVSNAATLPHLPHHPRTNPLPLQIEGGYKCEIRPPHLLTLFIELWEASHFTWRHHVRTGANLGHLLGTDCGDHLSRARSSMPLGIDRRPAPHQVRNTKHRVRIFLNLRLNADITGEVRDTRTIHLGHCEGGGELSPPHAAAQFNYTQFDS